MKQKNKNKYSVTFRVDQTLMRFLKQEAKTNASVSVAAWLRLLVEQQRRCPMKLTFDQHRDIVREV